MTFFVSVKIVVRLMWLVFQEVESLTAVKGKLPVARQEREPLGDGMGYDDVVAGVAVIIRLIELEFCVSEGRITSQRKKLYAIILLNGSEHLLGRLPVLGQQGFVVEVYDQLACCLKTGIGHRFWIVKDVPKFKSRLVGTCYQVDNGTSVKQQSRLCHKSVHVGCQSLFQLGVCNNDSTRMCPCKGHPLRSRSLLRVDGIVSCHPFLFLFVRHNHAH